MKKTASMVWIACYGVIVALSLVPHLLETPNNTDKTLHIYAYCLLTAAPFAAIQSRRIKWSIAGLLFLTGIANEVLQGMVGGRESSSVDAAANGIGIILGMFTGYLISSGLRANPAPQAKGQRP